MKYQISSLRHYFNSCAEALKAATVHDSQPNQFSYGYHIFMMNGAGWVVEVSYKEDAHASGCYGNLEPV